MHDMQLLNVRPAACARWPVTDHSYVNRLRRPASQPHRRRTDISLQIINWFVKR